MRVHKALFHLFQFGYSEGYCSTFHNSQKKGKKGPKGANKELKDKLFSQLHLYFLMNAVMRGVFGLFASIVNKMKLYLMPSDLDLLSNLKLRLKALYIFVSYIHASNKQRMDTSNSI